MAIRSSLTPPKPTTQPSTELDTTIEQWHRLWYGKKMSIKAKQAILTLIEQAILDGRIDEIAQLHTMAMKNKKRYFDFFSNIENRIAELQGLSNKEKGDKS